MAIVKPAVITGAYCASGTPGTDYIVPPSTGSGSVQSQASGWPIVFEQQLPPGGSGLPITRQQFNGVHNLYSSHNFWLQAGGTYTFESTISSAYSGYPAGQVLYDATTHTYQLSLVNSNTANFVTTPTYTNDGVNWQTISSPTLFNTIKNLNGSNYTVKTTDTFKLIYNSNAAACTLTLDANASSFPYGFTIYVVGFGTTAGTITLNLKSVAGLTTNITVGYLSPCLTITATDGEWLVNGFLQSKYILANLQHGQYSQMAAGSYSFTVPDGVNVLYVTGCGGGGGGGGYGSYSAASTSNPRWAGNGGYAGNSIIKTAYTVTSGSVINITVGNGGAAAMVGAGNAGASTVLSGGISLTLNGGAGGGGGTMGVSPNSGGIIGGNAVANYYAAGATGYAGLFGNQTQSSGSSIGKGGAGGTGGSSTDTAGYTGTYGSPGCIIFEW